MLENSIDAGATIIEIILTNFGLDKIEVSDNGFGIKEEDYSTVALKHYTSKITEFSDLEKVKSLGFRGEALNALCELSGKFSVTTKSSTQSVGCALMFNRNGR